MMQNVQTYWYDGKILGKQYPNLSTEDWISKDIFFKGVSKKSKDKLKDFNVDIFKNLFNRNDLDKLLAVEINNKYEHDLFNTLAVKNVIPDDNDLDKLKSNLEYCFGTKKIYS